MKTFNTLFLILVLFSACERQEKSPVVEVEEEVVKNEVMGTWKMVSYKYGSDSFFIDVPSILFYRKHVTPTHYSVVSYDSDGDNIYKSIGGVYSLDENEYTENIQYFYPPGSDLAGSSVTFRSKVENNRWHIEGYFKSVHLDPETAEYVQVDSTHIEEVWERL